MTIEDKSSANRHCEV